MLKMDIYQPGLRKDSSLCPAVIFIHGGSWMHGNRKEITEIFSGTYLKTLLEAGFIVVSLDYRLVSKDKSVNYPAPLADCKDAVKWIKKYGEHYGIDTRRMALMGTSAGAHLALMTAYAPDSMAVGDTSVCHYDTRVECVVDFYGPTKLSSLLKAGLTKPLVGMASLLVSSKTLEYRNTLLWAFTGESAAHPSKRKKKCRRYSPCEYVQGAVPTLIFHGTKDKLVPISQSKLLVKKMIKMGMDVNLHVLKGQDHVFPTISRQQEDGVIKETIDFLRRYLNN